MENAVWYCYIVLIAFTKHAFGNAHDFCGGLTAQSSVAIQQLCGMWYGVEIIDHIKNEDTVQQKKIIDSSCPVLYLSEEEQPTTEPPPYNYNSRYGAGYGSGTRYQSNIYLNERNNEDPISLFDRVRYGNASKDDVERYYRDIKKLKLQWDENGILTTYILRYNVSVPGFWISSGPENGSHLESKFNQFAGNIHIQKAVGNHMVLTFCQRLPDEKLFTVILSRSLTLNPAEVMGVHLLLENRELEIVSFRKVCVQNNAKHNQSNVFLLIIFTLILFSTQYVSN